MKKIFFIVIVLLPFKLSFSQERILQKEFFSCTLLVARSNDFPHLEEIFKKYWDVTSFKFIYPEEIEKYNQKDDNYYFFVVHDVQRPGNSLAFNNPPGTYYHFAITPYFLKREYQRYEDYTYYFVKGITSWFEYKNISADEYAFVPINKKYRSDTAYFKAETIRNIVHFRDYLKLVSQKKINDCQDWSYYVNDENNLQLFKEKTLLLDSNSCNMKGLTSDHYPFKYKLTNAKEIDEAICKQKSDIIYHRVTNSGLHSYHYFVNAEDGRLLYSDIKGRWQYKIYKMDLQRLVKTKIRQEKKSKK